MIGRPGGRNIVIVRVVNVRDIFLRDEDTLLNHRARDCFFFFLEKRFREVPNGDDVTGERIKIGHVARVTRVCSISILQESEAVVSTRVPRYRSQLGVRADAR